MTTINVAQSFDRKCPNGIIESYMEYAMPQESPPDFHMWTCLSLIAGAMGRQCYVSMGMFETYPPMYIILVGESAITHKSTAIKMGTRPFRTALPDVPMLAQKLTPQALVHTLAQISEDSAGPGRAEAFLESSELSNLIGQSKMDDSLLKVLTELWDAPDHFAYSTMQRGVEKLSDVCLNLLGGSTPVWLRSSVPDTALEGGFFSRLILVNRPPKGEKNPCPIMTAEQRDHLENVKNDLACIRNNMAGEFIVEPSAQAYFNEWYHEHNHPGRAQSFMRGYYGRKGDFLQKVAMCLSASYSDDMLITYDDMAMALKLLNENERYTKDLVKYMGTTEDGTKYLRVQRAIKTNVVSIPPDDLRKYTKEQIAAEDYPMQTKRGIYHSELLQGLSHQLKRDDVMMTIESMLDSGEITVRRVGKKGKKVYLWTGVQEIGDEHGDT